MSSNTPRFWESKALSDMNKAEWEALCDGCGKCCLHKLEDEDSGEIVYTDIACELLDCDSCQCGNYSQRKQIVPDCLSLSPETIEDYPWLPSTCAYRMLSEGRPLEPWHPLLSGRTESVHEAGMSVSGRVLSAAYIHPDDYEERVVFWVS